MTEERRRLTDPWLEKLFDQNEEQHRANRADNKELRELLHALAMKDESHGNRITILEAWRDKSVDPTLKLVVDGASQAKGASKVVKALYAAGLIGGGGAAATWGGKLLAAIFSAAPK